jgi:hypothetical protein
MEIQHFAAGAYVHPRSAPKKLGRQGSANGVQWVSMLGGSDRFDVVVVDVSGDAESPGAELAAAMSRISELSVGAVEVACDLGERVVCRGVGRASAERAAYDLRTLGAHVELRPSAGPALVDIEPDDEQISPDLAARMRRRTLPTVAPRAPEREPEPPQGPKPSPPQRNPPASERLELDLPVSNTVPPRAASVVPASAHPSAPRRDEETLESPPPKPLGRDRVTAGLLGLALGLAVAMTIAFVITRSVGRQAVRDLEDELAAAIVGPLAVQSGELRAPSTIEAELDTRLGSMRSQFFWIWLGVGVPAGVALGLAPPWARRSP